MIKNIFEESVSNEIIERINNLSENAVQKWGKMSVGQMLAHCNVTYEMAFDELDEPKPKGLKKWMLTKFVKPIVTGEKPYKRDGRTAPSFIKTGTHDFNNEKLRLIDYINKTQSLGANHFEGKASHSFGELTSKEWNVTFYKHLNHHLNQFGV